MPKDMDVYRGKRYGKLIILDVCGSGKCFCRCDCGTACFRDFDKVLDGTLQGCDVCQRPFTKKQKYKEWYDKHGKTYFREWRKKHRRMMKKSLESKN